MSVQLLSGQLTVPPLTSEYNPVYIDLWPSVRRLISISFEFPPGCMGAVKVRALEGGRPIAPQIGWYYGDSGIKTVALSRLLEGPPYRITIQGYSTALDYPHTIAIYAELSW